MGDVQRFRTPGGWHIELPVPLSDRDQARVDAGELTPVDDDGQPITSEFATGGVVPPGSTSAGTDPGEGGHVDPPPTSAAPRAGSRTRRK